ncbi:hypothetical protein [Flaviaesturariibacter amylovorans]|uniref:hypothetical protein n=1 Tax=Flaviaesturariibacter amylovorans TaxID=1084520 RepID=UPI0031E672E9
MYKNGPVYFLSFLVIWGVNIQASRAQSTLPKFDGFAGLLAGRALNISKDIYSSTGFGAEVGVRRNFSLGNGNCFVVGLTARNNSYHVEGYFERQNSDDLFLRTPDNVKVNRLEFTPVSIITGYRRSVGPKIVLGVDFQTSYVGRIDRNFKVGSDLKNEPFDLNNSLFFGLGALISLPVSTSSSWRYELFSDYSLSSYSSNRSFNPFSVGIRISRGFGK